MNILQGKKTIITGAVMVALGFLSLAGIEIPGIENGGTEMIGTGFGLIFLRMGVKTG